MLRSLANYFLGENVQGVEADGNEEDPQSFDVEVEDDDWVVVNNDENERIQRSVCVNENDPNNANANIDNNNENKRRNNGDNDQDEAQIIQARFQDHVDEERGGIPKVEESQDEDFAWENSLIEHPSLFLASQHLQQQQQQQQQQQGNVRRSKRRTATAALNGAQQPPQLSQQQQQSSRTNTSNNSRHVIQQQQQQQPLLHILDVLKQQEKEVGGGKQKKCHRESLVHQNVRNKPQRRSDKQIYTRFSRANNDRKCC